MTTYAKGVQRGCGTRVKGGVYAEAGLSPYGEPVEHFLIDPPVRIKPDVLGLSSIGVTMVHGADGETWHVMDWVGSQHYPNVADFVEEVRRLGLSRRLPKTLDFSKLTEKSKIILVHSRAWIGNHETFGTRAYQLTSRLSPMSCPKNVVAHQERLSEMCPRMWWWDVQEGEPTSDNAFTVSRRMPWGSYIGCCVSDGLDMDYQPAIFAAFPIHRLAVISDHEGGTHEDAAAKASKSLLDVTIEEE